MDPVHYATRQVSPLVSGSTFRNNTFSNFRIKLSVFPELVVQ